MSGGVENLIPARLDQMREGSRAFRDEVATSFRDVREGIADLETPINGLTPILTDFGGDTHDIDRRLRRLEGRDD